MFSRLELGWLNGIFDGGGHARIYRTGRHLKGGRKGYSADVVAVTNTDLSVINRVVKMLDRMHLSYCLHECNNCRRPTHLPCWQVRISNAPDKVAFLTLVKPHLTGFKKQSAEVTCTFVEMRIKRGRVWKRNALKPAKYYAKDEALYRAQPLTNGRRTVN